jgi:hypothetical protein
VSSFQIVAMFVTVSVQTILNTEHVPIPGPSGPLVIAVKQEAKREFRAVAVNYLSN